MNNQPSLKFPFVSELRQIWQFSARSDSAAICVTSAKREKRHDFQRRNNAARLGGSIMASPLSSPCCEASRPARRLTYWVWRESESAPQTHRICSKRRQGMESDNHREKWKMERGENNSYMYSVFSWARLLKARWGLKSTHSRRQAMERQMEDEIGASPSGPTLGVFIWVRVCRDEVSSPPPLYDTVLGFQWSQRRKKCEQNVLYQGFILHNNTMGRKRKIIYWARHIKSITE